MGREKETDTKREGVREREREREREFISLYAIDKTGPRSFLQYF